jgi:hypothetical protein
LAAGGVFETGLTGEKFSFTQAKSASVKNHSDKPHPVQTCSLKCQLVWNQAFTLGVMSPAYISVLPQFLQTCMNFSLPGLKAIRSICHWHASTEWARLGIAPLAQPDQAKR